MRARSIPSSESKTCKRQEVKGIVFALRDPDGSMFFSPCLSSTSGDVEFDISFSRRNHPYEIVKQSKEYPTECCLSAISQLLQASGDHILTSLVPGSVYILSILTTTSPHYCTVFPAFSKPTSSQSLFPFVWAPLTLPPPKGQAR